MLADLFDAFLLDLDGVVYLGDEPLPHARESLERLRERGKALRFLTNDPRPTRDEVARRLSGMGVQTRAEEVVTSGSATAGYLAEAGLHSAYVVGSPGLASEIRDAGVEVVNTGQAEAVVVGADERTSYRHVEHAARLVRGGAYFVATNPDGSFPTEEGSSPGTGAIVAAVEVAAGRRPDAIIGKPHRPMFDLALAGLGAQPSRIAVVGDNPETDILGAHQAALAAVLISESPVEFPSGRDFRAPDATIPNLSFLFEPGMEVRRWEKPPFPWPERVAAGVAATVFDSSGRVLLGKRADNGLWGLPSGHVEPGETVAEAVRREVREETGLRTETIRLVGVYSDPVSQVFTYPTGEVTQFVTCAFRCRAVGGRLRPDGKETADVAFFDPGQLPREFCPCTPSGSPTPSRLRKLPSSGRCHVARLVEPAEHYVLEESVAKCSWARRLRCRTDAATSVKVDGVPALSGQSFPPRTALRDFMSSLPTFPWRPVTYRWSSYLASPSPYRAASPLESTGVDPQETIRSG